jgi:hypothetical protein
MGEMPSRGTPPEKISVSGTVRFVKSVVHTREALSANEASSPSSGPSTFAVIWVALPWSIPINGDRVELWAADSLMAVGKPDCAGESSVSVPHVITAMLISPITGTMRFWRVRNRMISAGSEIHIWRLEHHGRCSHQVIRLCAVVRIRCIRPLRSAGDRSAMPGLRID